MKIGVFTVLLSQMPLEQALDYFAKLGIQMVELGVGNYPGTAHASVDELVGNKSAQQKLLDAVKSRGLEISALSCHGNSIHPDKEFAKLNEEVTRKAVVLASEMGLNRVCTFSGCPGDQSGSKTPNWVTCPWPNDFSDLLKWQWEEVLIPHWQMMAKFGADHGVKYCLEPHPGFCVYNVETMLKLNAAVGDSVGCNFDPSHMFWNGVDVSAAARKLGKVIYHMHAKDCRVDPVVASVNGCNDNKTYADEINRSWIFRTVGYGHDYQTWKDLISTLKMVGYDDVLSIEHEDSLMSAKEGLEKAVSFLKEVVIFEQPGGMWWV